MNEFGLADPQELLMFVVLIFLNENTDDLSRENVLRMRSIVFTQQMVVLQLSSIFYNTADPTNM